ncbi:MAG: hypothetical protein K8R88_09930, partial [Armatimonadetes bacterium]|nr:hypothetical protein [Armatimonadota bacterium]
EIVTPYIDSGAKKLPVLFVDKQSGVSITSQTQDQSSDHASLSVVDMTGQQIPLRWRPGTPIKVAVWDTTTNLLVTTLFRGIIGKSNADLFGREGRSYPSPDASTIGFDVAGEYARLNRRLVQSRIFLYDMAALTTDGVAPMKVTDAVQILLLEAGYSAGQMYIEDLPIRLFGDVSGTDLTIEPKTRIADTIFQMLEDYLGAALIWCPNSGTAGMWRLVRKPVPPYNVLMRFHRQHPGAKKLPSTLRSYPITSGVAPYTSQLISPNYMIRGTTQLSYEPPEGNCVTVVGGGSDENGNQKQYVRTVYNFASYNALALSDADPHYPVTTSPDYLGEHVEIWVGDASLNSQEAVDFVARRVFEIACYGREYLSFEAPLRFILDLSDPYQTHYRPLRFGDVVDVEQPDGSFRNYAVVRCSPRYTHDNNQTAFYELATCTNFDSVGMIPSSYDLFSLTRSRIRQARRQAGEPERIRPLRGKGRQVRYREMVMWAGADVPKQLQYMDTGEANFGQFVPMSGFDPGAI